MKFPKISVRLLALSFDIQIIRSVWFTRDQGEFVQIYMRREPTTIQRKRHRKIRRHKKSTQVQGKFQSILNQAHKWFREECPCLNLETRQA